MRAFAAVFTREVWERRMLFLVGLASGLLCLVASALHGWNAPGNAEVRLLAGSVGGLALAAALALAYGATTIAGETVEKRISFYFSRPVSAFAIWCGKLLAAVFVSFAGGLLVFLPGWLTGPKQARWLWGIEAGPAEWVLFGLLLVVVFVLVAHALATVARLRSPWVMLDLVLLVSLSFLALLILRTIGRLSLGRFAGPGIPVVFAAASVLASLAVALLLAPLAQLAAGRTDGRRAHGAFSLVFWALVFAGVTAAGAYAVWIRSATAADLEPSLWSVTTAPTGSWIAPSGELRGLRGSGTFLYDVSTGRSIRTPTFETFFSRNGARAAWGEPRTGFWGWTDHPFDLQIADLRSGLKIGTGFGSGVNGWMALSPSGDRIAVRSPDAVVILDVSNLERPRQISALHVSEDGRAIAFADEDTVVFLPRFLNSATRQDLLPASLEIAELSVRSKKVTVTGRFDRKEMPQLRLTPDGRWFLGVRRPGDGAAAVLTLHDRTGAVVATLTDGLRAPQARLLTGNRLVVAGIADSGARLLFFEGEKGWGGPARAVDLGPAARVVLGGEIAPGRAAVSLITVEESLPTSARASTLVSVDAGTGAVFSLGKGLVPASRFGWWFDPVMTPPEAGAPWTSLFTDADGRLVRLDPATGAQTVLLGKAK